MRRLRRKRRKMRQRARQQSLVRVADPWDMGDGVDAGDDGEVIEEEIIDYFFDWDDEDEDDAADVAAAIAEDFVEFEAAVSALSNISMTDASDTDIRISSSAPIATVSKWFLVSLPIWYLN